MSTLLFINSMTNSLKRTNARDLTSERCKDQRPLSWNHLKTLSHSSGRHLGRISTVRHRIKVAITSTRPVYGALYQVRPDTSQFRATERGRMLCEEIIGLLTTDCTSLTVPGYKKMLLWDLNSISETKLCYRPPLFPAPEIWRVNRLTSRRHHLLDSRS